MAQADDNETVGPTAIRFYSGNLSVGLFMHYWGMRDDGNYDAAHQHLIDVLHRTSCTSMCDYLAWCCVEREPGHWDWSFYETNERWLRQFGIGYNVFCWLHFPPRWYEASPSFVPYTDLVRGATIPQVSLWSPDWPEIADRFYRKLAARMKERIDFVRLAMPSEYGEIGYCAGMTHWLRPQPEARAAYWCGDPYARADFARRMLTQYGSLAALNAAWGTTHEAETDVVPPDPETLPAQFATSVAARRQWVDFLDWYQQSWVRCMEQLTDIVRQHLPEREYIVSLGYGEERPMLGNDQSRHIEAMATLHLAAQAPGDIGFFATRRVSSACRHYGVRYYTEPPGNVPRDRQISRIFMDACNGVQTWFDYLQNLDGSRDLFRRYKSYLSGLQPRCTVAVWHPTLDHWLHPEQPWSNAILEMSEPLRDLVDYEIVDDRMIASDALETLGIRHLFLAGATWLEDRAWMTVQEWVENGGVFIAFATAPAVGLDGRTVLWARQAPRTVPRAAEILPASAAPERWDVDRLWAEGRVSLGKGTVLTCDSTGLAATERALLTGALLRKAGAMLPDGRLDGVLCTRFDDKLLYFNTTSEAVHLLSRYEEADFPAGSRRPATLELDLLLAPRAIAHVPLQ